jgi:hypothetical protein
VSALGGDRIQFDFEFDGVRYRPTLERSPTEANLKRARKQLQEIKQRIDAGTFVFARSFLTIALSRMWWQRRNGARAIKSLMNSSSLVILGLQRKTWPS